MYVCMVMGLPSSHHCPANKANENSNGKCSSDICRLMSFINHVPLELAIGSWRKHFRGNPDIRKNLFNPLTHC